MAISDLRIAIAEDTARKLNQIEDNRRKQHLAEEKALHAQLRTEQAAFVAAFRKTTLGQIMGAVEDTIRERTQKAALRFALDQPGIKEAIGLLGIGDEVRARLGLTGPSSTLPAGFALPGRPGGVEAGAFRGGIAAGAISTTAENDEKKRTRDVSNIDKVLTAIMRLLSTGNIGGGGAR
jgi:hypothetical protein